MKAFALNNSSKMLLGKIFTAICFVLLASLLVAQTPKRKKSYLPPEGMVPNSETATKIAEAVLTPIYGKDAVENEKPFRIELANGVWIVDGVTHAGPGGNLHIEISKKDGRIVRVIGTE
jgi:NTF2 fold immunity protein